MADHGYICDRKGGDGRGGFTLIEVMAAAVIALPLLIVLMQIVPGMLKVGTRVEVMTKAAFLAEKKMEEIRGLINSADASYGFSRDYSQAAASFPSPDLLYKFVITDGGGSKIKDLSVTVWGDGNDNNAVDADEHAVTFDTKAAK